MKRLKYIVLLFFIFIIFIIFSSFTTATIHNELNITPTHDTYIRTFNTSKSYGDSQSMYIGFLDSSGVSSEDNESAILLFEYDLSNNSISIINNASLYLYVYSRVGSLTGTIDIDIYNCSNTSWVEDEVTHDNWDIGGGCDTFINTTSFNSDTGVWYTFTVTTAIGKKADNVTLFLNTSDYNLNGTFGIYSKDTVTSFLPYLYINYTTYEAPDISITAPVTGYNYTTITPLEWNIINETAIENCSYMLNGVKNYSVFSGGGFHNISMVIAEGENIINITCEDIYQLNDTTTNTVFNKQNGSISSCLDLQHINDVLNNDYELVNNIDCSSTRTWNNGKGFIPIGNDTNALNSGTYFRGNFNGNNYTISNLFINESEGSYVGLFGHIVGNISNLALVNVSIYGEIGVGGFAGILNSSVDESSIDNCYVTGTIYGDGTTPHAIGGLIGVNHGNISNVYSRADIDSRNPASNSYFGGIVGLNYANITNVYSVGNITGQEDIGGIAGSNRGYLINCFTDTNLTWLDNYVGGVVGQNLGTIENCYWRNTSYNVGTCWANETANYTIGCTATPGSSKYFYNIYNNPLSFFDYTIWDNSRSSGDYPSLLSFNFTPYVGGDGSSSNPFQIISCKGLEKMDLRLSSYYILNKNINCTESYSYSNKGFEPIASGFTGQLNGNKKTISNIYINRTAEDNIGLFSHGASIYNVGLKNVNITGRDNVGGLVGYFDEGSIINGSYVTGTLSGNDGVGGLVGINGKVIYNSYTDINITGNKWLGGIAGYAYSGNGIKDSYSAGTLYGGSRVGGLIGSAILDGNASVNCFTDTIVNGTSDVGGFVGYASANARINNSYWNNVSATSNISAGGIAINGNENYFKGDVFSDNPPLNLWKFTDIWLETYYGYPKLVWENVGGNYTKPIAENVTINPSPAGNTDDLNCTYDMVTYNGLVDNLSSTFKWFNNSILSGLTTQNISSSSTNTGEKWLCEITPIDNGSIIGLKINSSEVTIGDSTEPTIISYSVTSNVQTNDIAKIYANATDADSSLALVIVQFTNPNGDSVNKTMVLSGGTNTAGSETKWNYNYTVVLQGVWHLKFFVEDSSGNKINTSSGVLNFTVSEAPTASSVNIGGGPSLTAIVARKESNLTEIRIDKIVQRIKRGDRIVGEFKLYNLAGEDIKVDILLDRELTSDNTENWVSFRSREIAFTELNGLVLKKPVGLQTEFAYIRYNIIVPQNTTLGKYLVVYNIVDSNGKSNDLIFEIEVVDSMFDKIWGDIKNFTVSERFDIKGDKLVYILMGVIIISILISLVVIYNKKRFRKWIKN